MDAVVLRQLAGMIYDYCGIDYNKNLSSLESKISGRLHELSLTCWEYCGYLRVECGEWDKLIELVTVNETFFYREEGLLEEFRNTIISNYQDRTPENPLKIWSAACSSGEEPYTLGMIIEETGLFQPGSVQILATDINKKVLAKAKAGRYHKKSFSFRKMPEGALAKFFIEEDEEYLVKETIKNMVQFRQLNLLNKNLAAVMNKMDIIICRNVLIYFDNKAIQSIIDNFYRLLEKKGLLFLGHSESLSFYKHEFESIYTKNIFYYKKGE